MNIRIATKQDREDIRSVHLSAFPEGEREIISKLAIDLLSEKTTPETISLVADTEVMLVRPNNANDAFECCYHDVLARHHNSTAEPERYALKTRHGLR